MKNHFAYFEERVGIFWYVKYSVSTDTIIRTCDIGRFLTWYKAARIAAELNSAYKSGVYCTTHPPVVDSASG